VNLAKLIRKASDMAMDLITAHEPSSIAAAVRHGRFGSACASAMIAITIVAAICAIFLMIGTDGAFAGPRDLITIDDGSGHGGVSLIIAISVVVVLLASVAFNGLTPGHARRRRERR